MDFRQPGGNFEHLAWAEVMAEGDGETEAKAEAEAEAEATANTEAAVGAVMAATTGVRVAVD